jgi:hypothetical protein
MLFDKQDLIDLAYEEYEGPIKIVDKIDQGDRRWVKGILMIFEFEGKLYGAEYDVGLTECQDIEPFDYEDDEIECPEYTRYEKTIYAYRPKR